MSVDTYFIFLIFFIISTFLVLNFHHKVNKGMQMYHDYRIWAMASNSLNCQEISPGVFFRLWSHAMLQCCATLFRVSRFAECWWIRGNSLAEVKTPSEQHGCCCCWHQKTKAGWKQPSLKTACIWCDQHLAHFVLFRPKQATTRMSFKFNAVHSGSKGRRRTMEDEYVILSDEAFRKECPELPRNIRLLE